MAIMNPDLQIIPSDITFLPGSPKAGDALTISILVRNVGTGAANGGTIQAILQVDGAEVTRRDFPATIAASGITSLTWPVTTPAGRTLTVIVTASIANDSRSDNNRAQNSAAIMQVLDRQISPYILQVQPR
jgi:subtilase family serine protease